MDINKDVYTFKVIINSQALLIVIMKLKLVLKRKQFKIYLAIIEKVIHFIINDLDQMTNLNFKTFK